MFISSDTNVWLDFSTIGCMEHPFLLDNDYFLSSLTYHDEIDENNSVYNNNDNKERYSEIRKYAKENKIKIIDATIEELKVSMMYHSKYKAISNEDCIALAIAKERNWILLTGDGHLRNTALLENVECHGTLWIYKELLDKKLLSKDEYLNVMYKLLDAVDNKKRRLPRDNILKCIELNIK